MQHKLLSIQQGTKINPNFDNCMRTHTCYNHAHDATNLFSRKWNVSNIQVSGNSLRITTDGANDSTEKKPECDASATSVAEVKM